MSPFGREAARFFAAWVDRSLRLMTRTERPQPDDSAPSSAPLAGEPPLEVLFVDDSPTNLRVTGSVLRRLGAAVTTAETGEAALEHALQTRFSLVLLDCQLPGMDGPETARQMIQRLGGDAPPILALTGAVDLDVFRACRAAGMRLVLQKPVPREHLEAIVARLLVLRRKSPHRQKMTGRPSP